MRIETDGWRDRVEIVPFAMGSRDFGIFMFLCVAALAAGLVWISIRDRDPQPANGRVGALAERVAVLERKLAEGQAGALAERVASLERKLAEAPVGAPAQRVAALERELAALRSEVDRRLKEQSEQLARLARGGQVAPQPTLCLQQLQQEIDDLRGYVRFRSPIRRRVTAECAGVLKPRFGG